MSYMTFTKEEDSILTEYYPVHGTKKVVEELSKQIGSKRSRSAVQKRAAKLGLVRIYDYHDDWIRDNFTRFNTNRKMWQEYKKVFSSDISYSFFVQRANKLNLRRQFTEEMIDAISDAYLSGGAKRAQEELLDRFGIFKNYCSFHKLMSKRNIAISDDTFAKIVSDIRNLPEGTVRFHKHGSGFVARVKTDDDWVSYGEYICGNNKDGYIAVPLDRNPCNLDPENWMLVTKESSTRMLGCKLWSDNPEVTKTGILICELIEAMKQQEKEN